MIQKHSLKFNEAEVLEKLKHHLPAQAPLKDFIHHNTLHGFQNLPFHEAAHTASSIFGYQVYADLTEYRKLYFDGKIDAEILDNSITLLKGNDQVIQWKKRLISTEYDTTITPKIGRLRNHWKSGYKINLDKSVFSVLFRITGNYLDQGISIWQFPTSENGFLDSIRKLEQFSFGGIFSGKRAKKLLLKNDCSLSELLHIVVGEERYFEQYLFDQQFAHPGWSGMVAVLESQPEKLLNPKAITLRDFIILELLLEIDTLDKKFGENWRPLAFEVEEEFPALFGPIQKTELSEVLAIWQHAREWSYYNQVINGIKSNNDIEVNSSSKSFQALFCIDDRSGSLRRHLENEDPNCETFGTPGHFNVACYFQPEHGKFTTKICPAPLSPKHLIVESESSAVLKHDNHFSRQTHGLIGGWLTSQTLGFWSAIQLALNIFIPSKSPAMVSSGRHMDPNGILSIEKANNELSDSKLQIGFSTVEMADNVEGLLRSIGLINNFAPIIYTIGHGASSVNNTHYAGYDCGACSGRPGSVNARAIATMANHSVVRYLLGERGINIPEETRFIGGLHDTTRDEITFYDEHELSPDNKNRHEINIKKMNAALVQNAKERARRFVLMDKNLTDQKRYKQVKNRSVSLFEPRPELNHATNCICIVGRRNLSRNLFLDRRAFLNSYNPNQDVNGTMLLGILKAVAPVCGGINLEYYFSKTDNSKLGAGTKLPHNVVGLIGVANGIDGDLRTGLPAQMTEVHDPLRLLVIVEQHPDVVLKTIKSDPATFEWFSNEWVHLVSIDPNTHIHYVFNKNSFEVYNSLNQTVKRTSNIAEILNSSQENIPVYKIESR
jgi:uncharacterized protein YbcC (UPF0753/DUF2309 family)